MHLAKNIHKTLKREAQRRDLFLFKTNDSYYCTESWHETNKLFVL